MKRKQDKCGRHLKVANNYEKLSQKWRNIRNRHALIFRLFIFCAQAHDNDSSLRVPKLTRLCRRNEMLRECC